MFLYERPDDRVYSCEKMKAKISITLPVFSSKTLETHVDISNILILSCKHFSQVSNSLIQLFITITGQMIKTRLTFVFELFDKRV